MQFTDWLIITRLNVLTLNQRRLDGRYVTDLLSNGFKWIHAWLDGLTGLLDIRLITKRQSVYLW